MMNSTNQPEKESMVSKIGRVAWSIAAVAKAAYWVDRLWQQLSSQHLFSWVNKDTNLEFI